MDPFFPNAEFAWGFLLALAAFLAAATYFDLRYFTIPNKLTVPGLVVGIAVNIARAAWLGYNRGDALAGAFDGFLFASLGFLFGFVLFLVFWALGVCAGGDVKLFAAIAGWLGYKYSFWVWLISYFLLAAVLTVQTLLSFFFRRPQLENVPDSGSLPVGRKKRRGILPYALLLTISAFIVTLWVFRIELKLVDRKPARIAALFDQR